MYSAMVVAKYIIAKCIEDDCVISNLQLQKILFYIQVEFLRNHNEECFSDAIEAWQFGPVVPEVYYYYCGYGAMGITENDYEGGISEEDKAIINPIVEEKRKKRPWDLVAETHQPGGAWAEIYKNGEGNHTVIPVRLIKEKGVAYGR